MASDNDLFSTNEEATQAPVDQAPLDLPVSEDAPAKKPARKRAAKKVSASGDEKPAKAPKATKTGKTSKKAVSAGTDLSQVDGDLATPAPTSGNSDVDVEVESQPGSSPAEAAPQAAPAAPATFGLIFQAPEPTVLPRRRRATAPAQAPAETPAAADEDTSANDRAPRRGASSPTEGQVGVDGDDTDESGKGRRRRGGRGRRVRSGDDANKDTNDKSLAPDSAANDAASGATDRTDSERRDDTNPESGDDASSAEGNDSAKARPTRKSSRRGRGAKAIADVDDADGSDGADSEADAPADDADDSAGGTRRRRRRRRSGAAGDTEDPPGTVTKVREPRKERSDEPTAVKGSTRLEAKKQRRREGREAGRRRTIITEAEFLARRESVERVMVVRGSDERTQIGVLEDDVLVEHYVSRETTTSMAGNVYLGRVQNVLPSMEAAFVDIGKGRNAVLYAGEVNWDAAGLEVNQAKRIENALSSGDTVLVQVTKDPIGHKGARLTSQISLPGRFLVYVPEGSMTGISRKLPDTERARLKAILKEIVPDSAGVIVRTAAEGASEEDLRADVERLTKTWDAIKAKADSVAAKKAGSGGAPALVHGEPDLTVRVIRDIFTEDFASLVVSGDRAWQEVRGYVDDVAPDLAARLTRWTDEKDIFSHYRVHEQIAKAMDRKVWLPSGGSLVIDRTEAMTVVDVNTGKFVGSGGNLEETVTKNNIEAAEEIVRQLRLRDIGGIIVIDFIDMVLEANRDLVVRRLLECLGRDRTKHQVAEVTSLGLVQMTRKRVGSGLIEVFSETCEACSGRGIVIHSEPVDKHSNDSGSGNGQGHGNGSQSNHQRGSGADGSGAQSASSSRRGRRGKSQDTGSTSSTPADNAPAPTSGPTAAQIAAAAHAAAVKKLAGENLDDDVAELAQSDTPPVIENADVTPASSAEEVPQQTASEPVPLDQPVVRPRRKRGRVVAPAGPPKPLDADLDAAPEGQ